MLSMQFYFSKYISEKKGNNKLCNNSDYKFNSIDVNV